MINDPMEHGFNAIQRVLLFIFGLKTVLERRITSEGTQIAVFSMHGMSKSIKKATRCSLQFISIHYF